MKTQGAIKVTVKKLARRILEKEERLGLSEERRHGDILRNLLAARQVSQGATGLTDEQILDNVGSHSFIQISGFYPPRPDCHFHVRIFCIYLFFFFRQRLTRMVGHETTAGSINFTLWELARHPKIQVCSWLPPLPRLKMNRRHA